MPLTFAVVSKLDATAAALQRFCRGLAQRTGLELEPVVLSSYSELLSGALEGRLQIVWAAPLIAMELEDQGVAELAVVVQRTTRSGYHSALFALAASRFQKVEDLVGARAAWVSRESASGYFVPRWHLRSQGVDLAKAFTSERFCTTHEAVTQAVLGGEADVGATHVGIDPVTGKLAAAPWLQLPGPQPKVRVLLLVGPIPGDVIAVGSRVDAGTRRQLAAALLTTKDDADSRALFEADRFDPVPRGHLDLLRRLSRFSETRA